MTVVRWAWRRLPWWTWGVMALVVIGVVDQRVMAVAGIAGAVALLAALVWVVRRSARSTEIGWEQAERWAAGWLVAEQCRHVRLTTAGADGGIDVLTQEWAVQVKHTERRVGRPAVQQIVGAALAADRRPAVVSTSGFTAPAIDYADEHQVALVLLEGAAQARRINGWADEIGRERRRRLLRLRRG